MIYPACVSLLSLCIATALVTDGQDAGTSTRSTTAATEAPSIDDFAGLAGHWRGEGLGGVCEEVWSQPLAGTMVGSFRLVVNGDGDKLDLRIRMSSAGGMSSWRPIALKRSSPDGE